MEVNSIVAFFIFILYNTEHEDIIGIEYYAIS